jgi:uncharacterized protein YndB with AHSA1/START domain
MIALRMLFVVLLLPIASHAVEGGTAPAVLDFSLYVVGSPKSVWDALTIKERVDQYYMCPQLSFDLRVGGSVAYGTPGKVLLAGKVIEIKEGAHLVYALAMAQGAETKVEVNLEEVSPGVTLLEMKQSSGTWTDKDQADYRSGWPVILSGLKTLVETGKPIPWKK